MFRALIPPIFTSGISPLPGHRPATSWVHYTISCNTRSSAPEDGRNQRPKHVQLIGIINKPLLLHLVGVYIIYINDARSNKYQIKICYKQNAQAQPCTTQAQGLLNLPLLPNHTPSWHGQGKLWFTPSNLQHNCFNTCCLRFLPFWGSYLNSFNE